MSDSDDTDILLLIPPNYFIRNAEQELECRLRDETFRMDKNVPDIDHDMPAPSAAYQFLSSNKKAELNHINSRLHNLNTMQRNILDEDDNFTAPSDISTISANTVRTQFGAKLPKEAYGMVHSTPKCPSLKDKYNDINYEKDGLLLEIDNFMDEERNYQGNWKHHSDDFGKPVTFEYFGGQPVQANSLPNTLICGQSSTKPAPVATQPAGQGSNLISLSEIWGKTGHSTAIHAVSQSAFKEEQLRRQHLEKTIRSLQSRLLEYQQRLSVAIEVDRTKDAAINSAQLESKSLNVEIQTLRDSCSKFDLERRDLNSKIDMLQQELAQAVNLATKFQEKNEKLENQFSNHTKQINEHTLNYKKQLEELELKLATSRKAEELAMNENNNLKDNLAKVEYRNEKFKNRCDELEKENSALLNKKAMLEDLHQQQKNRADTLEAQKKSLQDTLQNYVDNEGSLKRKLETQQKALKAHYQQQLENVVTQKVKEFQLQLDKTEETLKQEARDRERLIAERSVKQLELINEKNELELSLILEKHHEEVELYRIQLENASKKIDDLEMKLSCYKSKRADIAEKLHSVMEVQWQKALEILNSPNHSNQLNTAIIESSPECNDNNQMLDTPKTSKSLKPNNKENNFNVPFTKDSTVPPYDKLQAYIELLLSKGPTDIDKLNEILSLPMKNRNTAGKYDKNTLTQLLASSTTTNVTTNSQVKRHSHLKPPWKA